MSAVDQHLAALGALYGPSPEAQAKALPEVGEGLQTQLANLSMDPTPARCEIVAANLEGARRAVLRLREGLLAEGYRSSR